MSRSTQWVGPQMSSTLRQRGRTTLPAKSARGRECSVNKICWMAECALQPGQARRSSTRSRGRECHWRRSKRWSAWPTVVQSLRGGGGLSGPPAIWKLASDCKQRWEPGNETHVSGWQREGKSSMSYSELEGGALLAVRWKGECSLAGAVGSSAGAAMDAKGVMSAWCKDDECLGQSASVQRWAFVNRALRVEMKLAMTEKSCYRQSIICRWEIVVAR